MILKNFMGTWAFFPLSKGKKKSLFQILLSKQGVCRFFLFLPIRMSVLIIYKEKKKQNKKPQNQNKAKLIIILWNVSQFICLLEKLKSVSRIFPQFPPVQYVHTHTKI